MPVPPNDVRVLEELDLQLLRLLRRDGRMPNNALADSVGIAPSTCLGRIRRLREIGAIRGVHADVDPAFLGRSIQAMVAVRLSSDSRSSIENFSRRLVAMPEVLNVYFVSGSYDYLIHVAMTDTDGLRAFIVNKLSNQRVVASTETHIIFEHLRGQDSVPAGTD